MNCGFCSLEAAYAQAGDKKRMLAFLNKAMQDRCALVRTLKVDSAYDWLRGDPEFRALLARLRLSQLRDRDQGLFLVGRFL